MKILRVFIEQFQINFGTGWIIIKDDVATPDPSIQPGTKLGWGQWDAHAHLFVEMGAGEVNLPANFSFLWGAPEWHGIEAEILSLATWILSYKEEALKGLFGGAVIRDLTLLNWEKRMKSDVPYRYPIGLSVSYERFNKRGERLKQYRDQAMFERLADDSGMLAVHRDVLSAEIADEFTRRAKALWQAIEERVLSEERVTLGL